MAPAVERKEQVRRGLSDRSKSPVKTQHSPKGRSSPRRERSPSRRRSPARTRSPKRATTSHRKSPSKEKVPDRVRSPKHVRGRSPVRTSSSPSPSPRSKRLRRAHAEREPEKMIGEERTKDSREERSKGRERESREKERTKHSRSPSPRSKRLMQSQAEKSKEREHGRNMSREERDRGRHGERAEAKEERGRNTSKDEFDNGRHGEHGESRDTLSTRRSTRDKSDGGLPRSSRRDRSVSPERRGQSVSPEKRNHRSKQGSRSPSRGSKAGAREEALESRSTEQFRDSDLDPVAKMKAAEESLEAKEKDKQKPSFELSGKLAEETNRVGGVTLLFNEPPDARKPDTRWRLYVFKAGEVLNEPLYVHRQSCYLFGRERRVADIPTDHPSCSKQHAVIQYRQVEKEQPDGLMSKQVRPYIMDLGSTNGTFINDNRIEPQRYYELFEKDTIRFGNSSREYVILHENSAE